MQRGGHDPFSTEL